MSDYNVNVIKLGVVNIGSITRFLNDLDLNHIIIDKPEDFSDTKKIILPGIGSFDSFMKSLKSKNLFYKIKELVVEKKYSILGICVGMQVLFQGSEEGIVSGFGFINHECKKFESDTKKVPHIGWNQINIHKRNK